MSRVIEMLRYLDRKERFAVLREALGFDRETPRLDDGFRNELSKSIGISVPERAFLAADYHLDWIELALHLARRPDVRPGTHFENPNVQRINKNQEDIDLLVAFATRVTDRLVTHLVLIEAKAYLSWSNPQLKSKACRLKDIFGIHGRRRDGVELHFVLMTEQTSKNICTDEWPGWMKADAESLWLQYSLPSRYEITRCTDRGKQSSEGDHLRLRCVPPRSE